MKKILKNTILLLTTLVFMVLPSCFGDGEQEHSQQNDEPEEIQGKYKANLLSGSPKQNSRGEYVAIFQVSSMVCVGCQGLIEHNLSDKEGILSVSASQADESVTVTYDNSITNAAQIKKHIESIK